jgi:hypothetical protein
VPFPIHRQAVEAGGGENQAGDALSPPSQPGRRHRHPFDRSIHPSTHPSTDIDRYIEIQTHCAARPRAWARGRPALAAAPRQRPAGAAADPLQLSPPSAGRVRCCSCLCRCWRPRRRQRRRIERPPPYFSGGGPCLLGDDDGSCVIEIVTTAVTDDRNRRPSPRLNESHDRLTRHGAKNAFRSIHRSCDRAVMHGLCLGHGAGGWWFGRRGVVSLKLISRSASGGGGGSLTHTEE